MGHKPMRHILRGELWTIPVLIAIAATAALPRPAYARQADDNVLGYFSSSYEEARYKFLQSAGMAGAYIESYRHPLAGPGDTPLYTDVAVVGRDDATRALVIASGTHGIEGFAGSAIQTGLLREGISNQLPPNLKLVMIHAVNPYGFAWLRRVNEDNIDLNRNFVDHALQHAANPGYERLADLAAPETLSLWSNIQAAVGLYWYRLTMGKEALRVALSRGQYSHPRGLFYGGTTATWSSRTVLKVIGKHLSAVTRAVFIDVHTGLGPFGAAEIITNAPVATAAYRQAVECWGDYVKSTKTGASVSADISGPLKLAVPRAVPGAEVTAVSLELGTLDDSEVFWALRAENWLYHHGNSRDTDAQRIRSRLLQAFYPQDDTWKRAVWNAGNTAAHKALACIKGNTIPTGH